MVRATKIQYERTVIICPGHICRMGSSLFRVGCCRGWTVVSGLWVPRRRARRHASDTAAAFRRRVHTCKHDRRRDESCWYRPRRCGGHLADRRRFHRQVLLVGMLATLVGFRLCQRGSACRLTRCWPRSSASASQPANTVANMFIVEVWPREEWDARFGSLQAISGIGQVVGLLLAGFIGRRAFWVAAALIASAVPIAWLTARRSRAGSPLRGGGAPATGRRGLGRRAAAAFPSSHVVGACKAAARVRLSSASRRAPVRLCRRAVGCATPVRWTPPPRWRSSGTPAASPKLTRHSADHGSRATLGPTLFGPSALSPSVGQLKRYLYVHICGLLRTFHGGPPRKGAVFCPAKPRGPQSQEDCVSRRMPHEERPP